MTRSMLLEVVINQERKHLVMSAICPYLQNRQKSPVLTLKSRFWRSAFLKSLSVTTGFTPMHPREQKSDFPINASSPHFQEAGRREMQGLFIYYCAGFFTGI
ncbi:hypothetical protein ACM0P6_07010 [Komagataeibacter sucrofermentans]|uniref:hypothetical protein n=1 Tax=Komagataeibacter sucrofermentans TaxID=1053551 RepID=UPI0011B830CC|nr:hypothetical protein [Komagataeibacter sucrofermentans]